MEEMAWNTSLEEFTHIPDTSGQGLVQSSLGIVVKVGRRVFKFISIQYSIFVKLFAGSLYFFYLAHIN
jgi:hypothetical protein